jgi:hypothetical protein
MKGRLQLHPLAVVSAFSSSPHGRLVSPAGMWDYTVTAISVVVVLVSAYFCIKRFLFPAEEDETHIKNRILTDGDLTGKEGSRGREGGE